MMPAARRTYALLLGAAPGLDQELSSEIALLQALDPVDEIHIWGSPPDVEAIRGLVSRRSWDKVVAVTEARPTRDATIFDALTVIRPTARDDDLVLIADAEHRSLTEPHVSSCIAVAAEQGAAILASRVSGEVIHAGHLGTLAGLPRDGTTFLAAGLLVTEFSRMYDLYDWACMVATGAVESPYRWSLSQLGAVVVPS